MAKIEYRTGNILDDDADAIVIPVNCTGTMGKGLAKEFAERYTNGERVYKAECYRNRIKPGNLQSMHVTNHVALKLWQSILFFPTKRHWKDKSNLIDIAMSLGFLARFLLGERDALNSIALPALGCGLGGLDWKDVKPLLVQFADLLPETFTVRLYAPQEGK